MRADIDCALQLLKRTQSDLKHFPDRLKPARFRVGSRVLGRYNSFTDTLAEEFNALRCRKR